MATEHSRNHHAGSSGGIPSRTARVNDRSDVSSRNRENPATTSHRGTTVRRGSQSGRKAPPSQTSSEALDARLEVARQNAQRISQPARQTRRPTRQTRGEFRRVSDVQQEAESGDRGRRSAGSSTRSSGGTHARARTSWQPPSIQRTTQAATQPHASSHSVGWLGHGVGAPRRSRAHTEAVASESRIEASLGAMHLQDERPAALPQSRVQAQRGSGRHPVATRQPPTQASGARTVRFDFDLTIITPDNLRVRVEQSSVRGVSATTSRARSATGVVSRASCNSSGSHGRVSRGGSSDPTRTPGRTR